MRDKEYIVIKNTQKYCDSLDIDCLIDIVSNLSFSELEKILCQLLTSQNQDRINETCFMIRDSIVCGNRYSELAEFREKYSKSLIVKNLENLLFSCNRSIIKDAIYTLGKTCSYNSLPALEEAFYSLRDTDPLILSRLFCEMQWLGLDNFWELIDSMMSSDVFFTRWAVIDLLPLESEDNEENQNILSQKTHNCLEILKQDSHDLIQIEAEYKLLWMNFKIISKTLSKSERRKQRKQLERQYKTISSFETISILFEKYLNRKKMNSYTISKLSIFLDYFLFFREFHKSNQ